jgi:hypothetical protein
VKAAIPAGRSRLCHVPSVDIQHVTQEVNLLNVTTARRFRGQKLRARMVRDVSKELDMDLTRESAWKKDMRLNRSYGALEYADTRKQRKPTVIDTDFEPNNLRERRQTAMSVIDASIPDIILGAQIYSVSFSDIDGNMTARTDECRGLVQTSNIQKPVYRNPNGGK